MEQQYLIDSNAVIDYLSGKISGKLRDSKCWTHISNKTILCANIPVVITYNFKAFYL